MSQYEVFTEREVEIYLRGVRDARDIAQMGPKGLTASRKIQEYLTRQSMRMEVCVERGVFSPEVPLALTPEREKTRRNYGAALVLCFVAPLFLAWVSAEAMERENDAVRELTLEQAASNYTVEDLFFDPVKDTEYFSPGE